jgi:hypothetical protein
MVNRNLVGLLSLHLLWCQLLALRSGVVLVFTWSTTHTRLKHLLIELIEKILDYLNDGVDKYPINRDESLAA